MPSGIYKHKKCQGFQKNHKINNGRKRSKKFKERLRKVNLNKKLTSETKKKISKSKMGTNIKYKKITKKVLIYLYVIKKYSITKINKRLGGTSQNIWERMIKFNICRRTRSECKKGKLNPMFGKTGILHHLYIKNLNRKYPIEFNDKLKGEIRNRDNYECQNCKIKEHKCYRKLDIHHLDSNKNNCRKSNLISLCQSCHIKITNKKRKLINDT